MERARFESLMRRARLLSSDYGAGYQRGLRRHFHGERFGTAEEHEQWSRLGLDGDHRTELGRGYRDGFAGGEPDPLIGRPPLPPEQRTAETPVRTLRLSDEHWSELQARGGVQALREWLSRPAYRRTPPRT